MYYTKNYVPYYNITSGWYYFNFIFFKNLFNYI